ncbi:MAG: hypothetical protein ABSH50_27825 [Bryobacteraceae bacterium]|jgi:hypothetical protein
MRLLAIIGLFVASVYEAPAQITVPAGTKVPLRLTAPLDSTAAHPGDPVRAKVAFPVTVGDAVAIPPGTFIEGTIDKVTRRGRHAGFDVHFTQLTYANGYTVSLSSASADTRAAFASPLGPSRMANSFAPQQTQPTFPKLSIDKGAIIGAAVGITAAATVTTILVARRGHGIVLNAGATLDMTLMNTLELDAAKVAAAVALPPA